MVNNAEIESYWIEVWSDLYDLKDAYAELRCQLPTDKLVSFEEALEWVQQAVYAGRRFKVNKVTEQTSQVAKIVTIVEINND